MLHDLLMTALGTAGAALGAFLAVPQAVRAMRDGSNGISSTSFQLLFALGMTWMLYGIAQGLWLLAASDGLLTLTTLVVLVMLHRDGVPLRHNTRTALGMMLLMSITIAIDVTWLGWLAGVISIVLRYPQMQLVRSAPSISGVSLSTWTIAAATNACWCLYGLLNHDPRLTIATAINVIITFALIRAVTVRRQTEADSRRNRHHVGHDCTSARP